MSVFLSLSTHCPYQQPLRNFDATEQDNQRELLLAVKNRDIEKLALLLKRGIIPQGNRETPLGCACLISDKKLAAKMAEMLLQAGADPNALHFRGNATPPLILAIFSRNWAVVEKLLFFGAEPNSSCWIEGFTPLHMAASRDADSSVLVLLAYGANPEILDSQGKKPEDWTQNKEIKNLLQNPKRYFGQRI